MKKFALIISLVIVSNCIVLSQPPSPPADAGAANSGPVGNGAPIGSGLGIMLAMFAAWGGKKALEAGKTSDPGNPES
ncbi:MAG: hypothetical protein IPH20_25845 [Bacteroidales bacterium]|nr:hypothetical protein [Bacteroidales bacterium]